MNDDGGVNEWPWYALNRYGEVVTYENADKSCKYRFLKPYK